MTDATQSAPVPPPVATIFLHYDAITGEIDGWDSHTPDLRPGMLVLQTPLSAGIPDHKTHKVDVATGVIVAKTDSEKVLDAVPALPVINARIRSELSATDSYMLTDRPIDDGVRVAWKSYRQALRDLSKLPTPAVRIMAWPMRPDGIDAVGDLRSKV